MQECQRLCELKIARGAFWYLATPYTKYHAGLDAAYYAARDLSEALHDEGVPHYAPIVASHEWSKITGIDPVDLMLWNQINRPWMDRSHGLIIVRMMGWDVSGGIRFEGDWFDAIGRPVFTMDPRMLIPEDV